MPEIKQFDIVQLLRTKNVKYISEQNTSPHGSWSVIAVVGDDLLLSKNNCIIKIPLNDVSKIENFNVNIIYSRLGKLAHGKETIQ